MKKSPFRGCGKLRQAAKRVWRSPGTMRDRPRRWSNWRSWGLLLVGGWLVGCGPATRNIAVSIPVSAHYEGEPVDCRQGFRHRQQVVQLADLKFFVSSIRVHAGSRQLPLQLAPSRWSHAGVQLLDLEDGSLACAESGNAEQQREMRGSLVLPGGLDEADIRGLSFDLGVPFALNHQHPLRQPSPLNLSSMFWSWQLGHKFLRLDLAGEHQGWSFHLGSTGCRSASLVRAPEIACERPNLARITLPDWRPGQGVALALAPLLADLALTPTSSCMGHLADDNYCEVLIRRLGLSPDSGQPLDAAAGIFEVTP